MSISPLNSPKGVLAFRPGLPAAQVDRQLQSAVRRWQDAEHNVVLWYAELHRRRLFKELGYGSIHLYAADRLGFSQARSYQFLKLAERLQALPQLEKAVAAGEVGWTKARALARVATPQSEGRWLEQAKSSSRRELEAQIDQTRRRAKTERKKDRDQLDFGGAAVPSRTHDLQQPNLEPEIAELPVSVSVQFDSTQLARYEALLAKLRQRGRREDKAELLLATLESLLEKDGVDKTQTNCEQRTSAGPAYQILIQKCPECENATVPTRRGDRVITRNELSTALCDAKIKREGERNTSTLPPRIRRKVLERDRHRCRMEACDGRQFLHVHHIRAREDGGTHDLRNLITLCGACHRALHELGNQQQLAMLNQSSRVGEPAGKYLCGPDLGPQAHREHGHARTHFIPGYKMQGPASMDCRT